MTGRTSSHCISDSLRDPGAAAARGRWLARGAWLLAAAEVVVAVRNHVSRRLSRGSAGALSRSSAPRRAAPRTSPIASARSSGPCWPRSSRASWRRRSGRPASPPFPPAARIKGCASPAAHPRTSGRPSRGGRRCRAWVNVRVLRRQSRGAARPMPARSSPHASRGGCRPCA